MRRFVGSVLAILLSCQGLASADEHIAPVTEIEARLAAAGSQRQADIVALQGLLDTSEGRRACDATRIPCAELKQQVPLLDDQELRDLSRRASIVNADPVAGMGNGGKAALVLVGLPVVLLVLAAITKPLSCKSCF
jgi:hypothetical protein